MPGSRAASNFDYAQMTSSSAGLLNKKTLSSCRPCALHAKTLTFVAIINYITHITHAHTHTYTQA